MTEVKNTDMDIYWMFLENLNYIHYSQPILGEDNGERIQYQTEQKKVFLERLDTSVLFFFFFPHRLMDNQDWKNS